LKSPLARFKELWIEKKESFKDNLPVERDSVWKEMWNMWKKMAVWTVAAAMLWVILPPAAECG
jgi:hypothetical protein